jgi:hypothetical protein
MSALHREISKCGSRSRLRRLIVTTGDGTNAADQTLDQRPPTDLTGQHLNTPKSTVRVDSDKPGCH